MINLQKGSTAGVGLGLLAALAASLCCITPVLALLAGMSGVAATFSWLEPLRPLFVGLTVAVLGVVWYRQLRSGAPAGADCGCNEEDTHPGFLRSTTFLAGLTLLTVALLLFPHYAEKFYPAVPNNQLITAAASTTDARLSIEGMTCGGCEEHVTHSALQLPGVFVADASYAEGAAHITYDPEVTDIEQIGRHIEQETGYRVQIAR